MDTLLDAFVNNACGCGEPLTPEELKELTQRYPSFAAPAIALLRSGDASLSASDRAALQTTVALNARDIDSQAVLTSADGSLFASFYPPEESSAATTTDDAIAAFLETYGHSSPEEDRLLEQMIFNPVPDYGAVLSIDDEEPDTATDETSSIDAFVRTFGKPADSDDRHATPEEPAAEQSAVSEPEPAPKPRPASEGSSLSESLAKIYIKQRRYDKAYEIIRHLSLKNPKKSVYFADQLRFLQKLMLNSRFK